MIRIPYLRWWIAFALFLAAVFNYIDRSVLGLLAQSIQRDLHISDEQYAFVINCFLTAYTLAYLFSGRIVDRLGVRLSLALFVAWWSVSNALTGLARSLASLSIFRFMLGLGEAGGFTASPKAVSEWFPPSERGLAIGIYSLGGAVGATIAPILVAVIASRFGWRWVFAVSPVMAATWIVFWLWLYRKPAEHPHITERERSYLATHIDIAPSPATEPGSSRPSELLTWKTVLREPFVWSIMLARMLTDPVWYFYQFWMPKYLQTSRGLDQKGVSILWMVFLAADIGFLLGGLLSGRMIRRGRTAPSARLRIMAISALLVPLSALVPLAPSVGLVIAIGMVVAYAHTTWLANITSLVVDITPKSILGTVIGIAGCGSAAGGMVMNKVVAWIVTHRSYNDCFYLMCVLHPLALLAIWHLGRRTTHAIGALSVPSPALSTSPPTSRTTP
jgi:ACS family hexuronate transporter-like MFS transporter